MAGFGGTWVLARSENFEEYMKGMGVGTVMRKAASVLTPTCEVTQDGDDFEIKMMVPLKTVVQKFKIGEPFEDMSPTGEMRKMVATWEDGKLAFDEVEQREVHHRITREIVGNEMVMTCVIGDVVCKRIFKRK
ncbi:sodium/calcium exchanger regulatory protein 1-like [Ptychodera flava]|uniref:sodium/calcium exchanger regulatory protein 1-like n=1 Tax=Ptychodera flava TaxID=63121 RepID=UPI00396A6E55